MIRIILTLTGTAIIAFCSIYQFVQIEKLTKENNNLKTKLEVTEGK